MDGFIDLTRRLLREGGCEDEWVVASRRQVAVPGYFRPTKQWDLLVVQNRRLLAAVEFKALNGPSFGNNANNRTEEALGNAVDLATAYREGAFQKVPRPWTGYLLMLEQDARSTRPVKAEALHFKVLPGMENLSYAGRMAILCHRLVLEKHYDASCLILSPHDRGLGGSFSEPVPELRYEQFVRQLVGHVQSVL